MKYIVLFLLLFSLNTFAQKAEPFRRAAFRIDSLPKQGVLLDKGWKFHAGDNPDFAKADFDDSAWGSIDPTLVIPELKSKLSNQPLWLRLKFKSSTTKNNLFISIKQSGATEIYLNNHLIHAFGMIDTSNDKIKSYDPNGGYISLPIDTTENILAIKYYFEKGVRYKSVFDLHYPLFSVRIFSEKAVLESDKNKNTFVWEGFNLGFPLILFVVHFIIFLFYMPFRANLWYSLWALFTFISAYFLFQIKIEHNIALKNDYSLYAAILGGLGNLSLIYSLFLLLRQNNKRLLGIFFSITLLSIFSFLSESKLNSIIDFSFGPVFVLLVIYMAHSAYKQGNIGGKYVIYSMVLYLITWVLFILSYDIFLNNEWISDILFHIAVFCLPITMSILLGIDFRNIHKNFMDVTLEKQQILSTQNETLEKQVHERTAELEHKNRDLEIEAVLDKIRSRSLAMHSSSELKDVMVIMFEKMTELGIVKGGGIGIHLFTEGAKDNVLWVINQITAPSCISLPYDEKIFSVDSYVSEMFKAKETGADIFNKTQHFEEKNRYFDYVLANNGLDVIPPPVREFVRATPSHTYSMAIEKRSSVVVDSWDEQKMTASEFETLKRVARVFEQAYIRFIDLQKAEAQAREAQIEVSLERVRSKTLAMQSSDELSTVIGLIYTEMGKLDILLDRCFFMIFDPKTLSAIWWMGSPEDAEVSRGYYLQYHEHAPHLACLKGWKERKERWTYLLEGEVKSAWDAFCFVETELASLPKIVIDNMRSVKRIHLSASYYNFGCLMTATFEPLKEESFDILIRFSKVFDLTYTRFNDIKQAEAQAREAQIELALERVRSRAMSMQTSEEINAVIGKIFTECKSLEIQLDASVIIIYDKQTHDTAWYLTNHQDPNYPARFRVPHNEYPFNTAMLNAWHQKTIDWDYMLDVQEKKEWDKFVFSKTDFVLLPDHIKEVMAAVEKLYIKAAFNEFGCLMLTSLTPLNNEQMTILPRFSKVFELTYTRFNDLKLAEAQAKEGRIEIALERIRAKALAMESSTEINTVIATIYKECNTLFIDIIASLIIIYNEDTLDTDWYLAKQEDPDFPSGFKILHNTHNFSLAMLEGWKQKSNDWEYILKADEKAAWDDFIFSETDFSLLPDIVRNAMRSEPTLYTRAAFGDFGCIMLSTLKASSNEQKVILTRVTNVFDFAYKRFLDLQKAEAQARESQIEASFERIRASAMAMQTSDEFLGVVKTLYEQINTLGQKELEATIIQFYNIEEGFINSWNALNTEGLTTSNISLGTTRIPFDACELTLEWLNAYQSTKEDYTIVAKGEKLKEWFLLLMKVSPEIKDRLGDSMPEIGNFHFSKFSEGALSMVSQKPFSEESKYLLKRAASAFDLAYKRYLDLQLKEEQTIKLSLEKQRLEATLKELQATQNQLIQKEKLASLGELTAGIAHEIQNPLNFVNNFSELSVELIEELGPQTPDGSFINSPFGGWGAFMADISFNLQKINYHGKRASSIVSGMLEHSRTSTGERALTDINKLADEYLRLSYHGMKAKYKDRFTADYELIADENLPLINIVPQDIGRVLLNLINNAFYAVGQGARSKGQGANDAPKVNVSTKITGNQIIITVKDNGNGIPDNIKSKIFQPFFTTKPTGEGTGLGLSLAYDIVTKGHGGTIEVESIEGDRTTFIVKLPLNKEQ